MDVAGESGSKRPARASTKKRSLKELEEVDEDDEEGDENGEKNEYVKKEFVARTWESESLVNTVA